MKFVFLAAVLVSLPFGLCGDDAEDLDNEEAAALAVAKTVLNHDPNEVAPLGQDYQCLFTFSETSGLEPIELSCRWDIEEQAPDYIVTFREVWACNDFAADHEDYPPCDALTGFHEWRYLVNTLGKAELLDETGQFPPDYVSRE